MGLNFLHSDLKNFHDRSVKCKITKGCKIAKPTHFVWYGELLNVKTLNIVLENKS